MLNCAAHCKWLFSGAAICLLVGFGTVVRSKPLQAKQRIDCSAKHACFGGHRSDRRLRTSAAGRHRRALTARNFDANGNNALRRVIGGRPSGCPRAYCGCALARYLGLKDRRLWKAWNWAQLFSRTSARAGAVAVRRHHVLLLEQHLGGDRWLVRSYNGGRHLSWLYALNLRGYFFVDPNAPVGLTIESNLSP